MRSRGSWMAFAALVTLFPVGGVARADRFRADGRYDPSVPAPDPVPGFELGDRAARR